MNVRNEILDYINQKELTGALLLTGQWGCGKSYLIKEIAKELNESKKAAFAVISLFGLDSAAAINKRVKDEYLNFRLGVLGRKTRKISKAITRITKDSLSVANIATEGNPALAASSHGLSTMMSYDIFDFFDIGNKIGKDENERKFVIVFDDLERNQIDIKILFGVLNEFIENKEIKVIIIADQEKIKDEKYNEYKEKLISRTIKMSADYHPLIENIIKNYKEKASGYKLFLEENINLLRQVFSESQSNNLRTFKAILADFERVYSAWIESQIATENMKWALYTFAAELFISKEPPKIEEVQSKHTTLSLFGNEKEKQYPLKGENGSSFLALSRWISTGEWEKNNFINELRNRYSVVERTPEERFLTYLIWSLEQKDIDEGLPAAINRAYNGELSGDTLVGLLGKIHTLKSHSVKLPCEVDYTKIEDGFKKRISQIKQGRIVEPRHMSYIEDNQLDQEAISINTLIKQLDYQTIAWNNRKEFIRFICEDPDQYGYLQNGLCIDEFDDKMLDVFWERYSNAPNEVKRNYAASLLGLAYDSYNYSTKENLMITIQNLNKLIAWLSVRKETDSISKIINESFIQHLREKVNNLEAMLNTERC